MGRTWELIDDVLARWLRAQQVFFVGTAPAEGGHVNVSPKGGPDTFAVVGPTTVAYLDLTGSGVETIAHLADDGRITLMFCAFEGPPRIVRLQGRGRTVLPGDADFEGLAARFPARRGARAVIVAELDRIADSCGYAVPVAEGGMVERTRLAEWASAKGDEELVAYRATKNARSIDGLPGLPPPG